jgi:Ca2+-binding RTX toxin-like protein
MRQVAILLTIMTIVLLGASGIALALKETGTNRNDVMRGTNGPDSLAGGNGHDRIYGLGARDRLHGDTGRDLVVGGGGNDQVLAGQGRDRAYGGKGSNDFLNTLDERNDRIIDCGPGTDDEVYVDFGEVDNVANCEVVFAGNYDEVADAEPGGPRPEALTPQTITPEELDVLDVLDPILPAVW